MREIRLHGSEGGGIETNRSFPPLFNHRPCRGEKIAWHENMRARDSRKIGWAGAADGLCGPIKGQYNSGVLESPTGGVLAARAKVRSRPQQFGTNLTCRGVLAMHLPLISNKASRFTESVIRGMTVEARKCERDQSGAGDA